MRVLLLSAAFLLGLIVMGVSAAGNARQMAARATEDRPDVSQDYQSTSFTPSLKLDGTEG